MRLYVAEILKVCCWYYFLCLRLIITIIITVIPEITIYIEEVLATSFDRNFTAFIRFLEVFIVEYL